MPIINSHGVHCSARLLVPVRDWGPASPLNVSDASKQRRAKDGPQEQAAAKGSQDVDGQPDTFKGALRDADDHTSPRARVEHELGRIEGPAEACEEQQSNEEPGGPGLE
ncbi:hypothetical protein PHYSODRAFT_305053 [Phytophthora sojae]|uniref:Uncharacterized protein n=1 Tax=Phytophthora sojae (strain P6497) TaxID=1094619 RepID=G5A4G6_PHYSP|nr:hypothetical protein PHYSODRAFT_305053 [Phytophthora sojae]EGZ09567.1 hypothetical protein PHYSODRAFT_305053 [Phytophthora sojae]|eukprot:XP_009534428.1 hypothetical protein PHYSODRAFT_305053 [Phytophthora sojae]